MHMDKKYPVLCRQSHGVEVFAVRDVAVHGASEPPTPLFKFVFRVWYGLCFINSERLSIVNIVGRDIQQEI